MARSLIFTLPSDTANATVLRRLNKRLGAHDFVVELKDVGNVIVLEPATSWDSRGLSICHVIYAAT